MRSKQDLRQLMPVFRVITREFQKQMGSRWTPVEQINEIFSEVGELNNIVRKGNMLDDREKLIEEIWDVALSAITLAHVMPWKITDRNLLDGFDEVMLKLRKRIESGYYKKIMEKKRC